MNTTVHSENFHISAEHPALPGHFPGAPIVPGVILLDHVVAAVQRVWKMQVSGFAQVKFLRPLKPEQRARLTIERDAAVTSFRILEGTRVIARGLIQVVA